MNSSNLNFTKQRCRNLFLLVGIVCSCVACEPVPHYNRLQIAAITGGPKKPYGTIKLFPTVSDIKRPYEIAGMMSCEGSPAEEAAIVNAMLHRAADMGADGVLLNPGESAGKDLSQNAVDVRLGWAAVMGGNRRAYRAQAIRFTD